MITKAFEKFSYTSAGISSLLLLGITYYYLTLPLKWSFFESKIFNGLLIFGALMLTNYAIDTITRELTIERANRNAYHLLLYPILIFSFPIESIDMRFILSSAAIWSAWRNMRIFFELTNNEKQKRRLFDASLLLSFASLIILENLIIFIYPLIVLITANIKRDSKHFIILFFTPFLIIPPAYVISSFFSLDSYLFSSYFFGDQHQILNGFKLNLSTDYIPISIIFILYLISFLIKFFRTFSLKRRVLDIVGFVFIAFTSYSFFYQQDLSGSELHYLSLILVYFISQLFAKKISSLYLNFIFTSIIVSTIIFKFII
tara:strand:+ start:2716 stop:3663 length:948 start_codon:yes stop_codon:yes gene_type:complete